MLFIHYKWTCAGNTWWLNELQYENEIGYILSEPCSSPQTRSSPDTVQLTLTWVADGAAAKVSRDEFAEMGGAA